MNESSIVWTDYMRYRVALRGFDLARIEHIVRYSDERYVDRTTGRFVAVGRHANELMMIPYEVEDTVIRPVTVHATTRAQIQARIRSGRFAHE